MDRKIKVIAYDVNLKSRTNLGFYLDITGVIVSNSQSIKIVEYVGHEDCDGNEIFEGHILSSTWDSSLFKWLVKYQDGAFGIVNIAFDGHVGDFYRIDSRYFFLNRRIVGHMYSNPELLLSDVLVP